MYLKLLSASKRLSLDCVCQKKRIFGVYFCRGCFRMPKLLLCTDDLQTKLATMGAWRYNFIMRDGVPRQQPAKLCVVVHRNTFFFAFFVRDIYHRSFVPLKSLGRPQKISIQLDFVIVSVIFAILFLQSHLWQWRFAFM